MCSGRQALRKSDSLSLSLSLSVYIYIYIYIYPFLSRAYTHVQPPAGATQKWEEMNFPDLITNYMTARIDEVPPSHIIHPLTLRMLLTLLTYIN